MVKLIGIVATVVIVLIVGRLVVGWSQQAAERSHRIYCASNLRQLGQAFMLYATQNRGEYPRGRHNPMQVRPTYATPYANRPDLGPTGGDKGVAPFDAGPDYSPADNDVTAALYLLFVTQDLTAEVLTCPSTGQTRWDFGGGRNNASNYTNFPGKKVFAASISYSMHNPYAIKSAKALGAKWDETLADDFVLMSDLNPGGEAVKRASILHDVQQRKPSNSLNHGRMGQNVLFKDGHVEMCGSPLVGPGGDNIFTAGPPFAPVLESSPWSGGDCVMLPTAEWAGITATPAQLDRRKMSGEE